MASTRRQAIKIAQKYVGCHRGSKKHREIVDTFNSVKPHGEVGNYSCAWCAMTWTAIQIKAGNDRTVAPYSYNCGRLIEDAKKIGCWVENDAFVPQMGDGIIYSWNDSGKGDCRSGASHVGIVEKVDNGYITVIEGNMRGNVCGRRRIKLNARFIRGFITPKYKGGKTTYNYELDVDGDWGYYTTITSQHILGVDEDGDFGKKSWKALQKLVGAKVDGYPGVDTYTQLARFLGFTKRTQFRSLTPTLVRAWQRYCNAQL